MNNELVVHAPAPADEWNEVVDLWIYGKPESTRSVYLPVIEHFRKWLEGTPINQIKLRHLQQYASQFKEQKPATVGRKLATVKSLLTFAHATGMCPFNVGAAFHVADQPDRLCEKILPTEDIRKMVEQEPNIRNRTLIRVLYASGIRAAEASGLRWKDAVPRDDGDGQITVIGKGSKTRSVRLSLAVWNALLALKPATATGDDPIFARQNGGPMSRFYITIVVSRAGKRAGIPQNVSAHWMRHGHATHALQNGASLPLIQQTLGHADLATTSRYLHIRPGESSSKYIDV